AHPPNDGKSGVSFGESASRLQLRAEEFQKDVFRQAQQIRKRLLAVARRILRDVLKQHAHALAAGLFHGPVNRTRGFLGSDAAGGFKRRSKAGQQAQRGHQVVEVRRFDRKSTRLNSSHLVISYAVFCLKKKKKINKYKL